MDRELRKRKFRAIGSGALIFVAVSAYIGLAAMVPSTADTLELKVEELNLADYIVRVNFANETDLGAISSIDGVESADYRLVISSRMRHINSDGQPETFSATLMGIDPEKLPSVNTLEVKDGDGEYFTGIETNTSLLDRGFAYNEDISPGDEISVLTGEGFIDLEIEGLAFSPEYIFLPINPQSVIPLPGTLAIIYVPIDWLRDSFGFNDTYVNEFTMLFDENHEKNSLILSVNSALASNTIIYSQEKDQIYGYALIKEDLAQGSSFTGVIAFLILLVAFFVVYSSFARIVQEQQREIGVLRALGYSRGSVFLSYIYMAIIIGLTSSLIGVLFGLPLGHWLTDFYVEEMLNIEAQTFQLPSSAIFAGIIFGPFTACIACGLAVWGTVSMEPQNAIRGARGRSSKLRRKFSKEVKIRARSSKLSFMTLYALRSLTRHRSRTILTLMAIGFSVMLGSVSLLWVASFANSIEKSIDDVEHWDLVVDYSYPLDPIQAASIESSYITDRVQISKITGSWRLDEKEELSVIIGMNYSQTLHEFTVAEGDIARNIDEIMVGTNLAKDFDISPGQHMTISGAKGSLSLHVTAVVSEMIGELFIDIEIVDDLVGYPISSGMYVKCGEGQSVQVMDELLQSPLVADVLPKENVKFGILELMESFESFLYMFGMVGVGIAAVTIANVIFISILERYSEYGQLRAIGYSHRDISKSLLSEIFIIILVGSVLAIPLIFLFMEAYVDTFREFWPLYETIVLPQDWLGFGIIVLLTFIFSFLAIVPGIRYLGRIDIARTVSGGRFG